MDTASTLGHGQPLPGALRSREIGPYLLVERLGEGGMGEVWLADQVEPLRRRVAIKFVKPGMDSRLVLARFESERQALALMDHPAIAKVFAGGSTPDGRPYFAMEYVSGVPISEHCDRHRLTVAARLQLFLQLCEGAQHAHQKAILHRDLKPTNVLVALVDGKPQVKIIDFGIAKALAQPLTESPLFTEAGTLLGTPEYMSPEQADLTRQDVDTRSDVYSLGVMLYELLCGALPFSSRVLRSSDRDELRRVIREVEPESPSKQLAALGEKAAPIAEARQARPEALARVVRGDLDAIVLKAMEKERARRYGSVAELSADLVRYLQHRPVQARRAGAGYRLARFARRHRAGVVAGVAGALLLAAFVVAQAVQVRRTARERDRASQEAAVAKRVSDFLVHMFELSDPSYARGNTVTAREILDRGAKEVDAELANDPLVQARLMAVMGHTFQNLGLWDEARQLYDKALQVRTSVLGAEAAEALESRNSIGHLLSVRYQAREAEAWNRQTLAVARRALGAAHAVTRETLRHLTRNLTELGRFADAEPIAREVLALDEQARAEEQIGWDLNQLATALRGQKRAAEALPLRLRARQMLERALGPDHPTTLAVLGSLALDQLDARDFDQAIATGRAELEARRRVQGNEHPQTLMALNNLGGALATAGRWKEAETALREYVDVEARLRPDSPQLGMGVYNLAGLAALQGHRDEALALLTRAARHTFPPAFAAQFGTDDELKPLRGDPVFEAAVAEVKRKAAAAAPRR